MGKAGEWLGRSISLAPVLAVRGGMVVPYRLALNRQQGLRALVAAVHVGAAADAAMLLEEGYALHAGAAVSAVLGPGTVGLCLTEA